MTLEELVDASLVRGMKVEVRLSDLVGLRYYLGILGLSLDEPLGFHLNT